MTFNPYRPPDHTGPESSDVSESSGRSVRQELTRGTKIGALLGFALGAIVGITIWCIVWDSQSLMNVRDTRDVLALTAIITAASTLAGALMGFVGFGIKWAIG